MVDEESFINQFLDFIAHVTGCTCSWKVMIHHAISVFASFRKMVSVHFPFAGFLNFKTTTSLDTCCVSLQKSIRVVVSGHPNKTIPPQLILRFVGRWCRPGEQRWVLLPYQFWDSRLQHRLGSSDWRWRKVWKKLWFSPQNLERSKLKTLEDEWRVLFGSLYVYILVCDVNIYIYVQYYNIQSALLFWESSLPFRMKSLLSDFLEPR